MSHPVEQWFFRHFDKFGIAFLEFIRYNINRIHLNVEREVFDSMAGNYSIITETTCDLPQEYYDKNDITAITLTYALDGTEYDGSFENSLSPTLFYDKLRKGIMAKTSAIAPETFVLAFEKVLEEGRDILYIAFSSGLSSTYQNACIAKEELLEKYPNRRIFVVDSLAASLGEGLLVDMILRKAKTELDVEALAVYAESIKQNICLYFTVDDLNHLYRGGRVSKTTAFVGTMLGIKPVLHVDENGKLIAIGKIRGRKASLDALVAKMDAKIKGYDNPYVFISHGDCLDDAKYVAGKIKEKYGIKTEIINYVGPVIGSHSGPGTVALFFVGSDRVETK